MIASIDHVAQTAAEKSNLRATGASIVEMEAAGVAKASRRSGSALLLRPRSQRSGPRRLRLDFNSALKPDGRFSPIRLIKQLKLGELIRLKQRTDLASKKLGDFLAATTF